MIRARHIGEVIAAGDVIVIGQRAFPVLDTVLVGQIVPPSQSGEIYTSAPITELHECFPAKPAVPPCFECGEPSTHVWEADYEPKRFLCQSCFQEWEHNEERNERAINAY